MLGDLVGKVTMLKIAYSRCNRRGLLRLDRLIEEHGQGSACRCWAKSWPATVSEPGPSALTTAAASVFRSCPTSSCGGADSMPSQM
jgi:hypothetical protein